MKIYNFLFLLSALFFFNTKNYGQYITINESFTAQQLVENVLINSPCATVSNFSISGANYASGEKSVAYFDATSTSFPFQNGIVLSTGKAINTIGPNTFLSDDGQNMNWNGDLDLQTALNLGNSFNATVLEFDFVTVGNKFSFDYVFSSEQYLSDPTPNQCNFTDGFAFLLKEVGSAAPYQNLALVPNTTTPVKVNTVRGTGTICPPANAAYFDAFNGSEHPTNFNGQTIVLKAEAAVLPNTLYHIKLVIADEGNARFDSAIFLGGGSFNFEISLGDDRLLANGNPLCQGENLVLNATQLGTNTYQWFKDGTLLPGETNPTFNVTTAGNYSVEININGLCTTQGSIIIEYAPQLIVNENLFTVCDSDGIIDGFTNFNLEDIKNQIFTNLPSNFAISFFDSISSATILPSNFINTIVNQQTIYAKITNIQGCYNAYPITLQVASFTLGATETIGLCNGDSRVLDVPNGFQNYSWNTNPAETTNQITVNQPGNYTVTVTNSNNCTTIKTFIVNASEPAILTSVSINDFNISNTATINFTGIGLYEFSLDGVNYQANNTFTNLQAGNYVFFIRDTKGCGITPGTFQILDAPNFFTPNEDGVNDVWNIPLLELQPNTIISIFDRYGKLLYQFKSNQTGWDGKLNGILLPASDYWYTILFENGKIVKGHFSLIR